MQSPATRQQNHENDQRDLKAERRERDLQDFVPGEDEIGWTGAVNLFAKLSNKWNVIEDEDQG